MSKAATIKKIIIALILTFIVVFVMAFVVLAWFCCHGTSTVIVENQTGTDIHMVVVLWPDGETTTTRWGSKLRQNEKVTMKHCAAREGSVEIFFQDLRSSRWYHFHGGGYICPNTNWEHSVIIDKTDLLPAPLPQKGATETRRTDGEETENQ